MRLLWFEFGALTLLVSFLAWRYLRYARLSARKERNLQPGHGFDTTLVQKRLNHLRQDYSAGAGPRGRKPPGYELIVIAVRRSLAKLSYFRSAHARQTETELGNHREADT